LLKTVKTIIPLQTLIEIGTTSVTVESIENVYIHYLLRVIDN